MSSTTSEKTVFIIGRFPPPIDGQTMATRRLEKMLQSEWHVQRIDLSAQEKNLEVKVTFRFHKLFHFIQTALNKQLKTALQSAPEAPVLWTSISPTLLGHWRDRLTVLPFFLKDQPVYGVVHKGNFHEAFTQKMTRRSAIKMVKKLAGIVFLDQALADNCAEWIPDEKRIVIPNTIDEAVIPTVDQLNAYQQKRLADDHFRILFLSNMTKPKGYEDVLSAIALLHQQKMPIKADFAGAWESDQDKAEFEVFCTENNLQNVVKHHGAVRDRDKIRGLYAGAHVFVLPTYYITEAQPLTIIEAMSAGVPVIATHHAGIPGMIAEGENGFFVPAKSPETIAEAIVKMIDGSLSTQMSTAARNRFNEKFSPPAVQEKWLKLLGGHR